MTTARDLITLAFREANFNNSVGALSAEELSEGLILLQSTVDSLFGLVVGTKLTPWYIPFPQRVSSVAANAPAYPGEKSLSQHGDETLPPANTRLMFRNTDAPATVFLQYQPDDGAVLEYVDVGHTENVILNANGALFGLEGSVDEIIIEAVFPAGRNPPRRWAYRGDYGSWLALTDIGLDTVFPFPRAFDDYFVMFLAIRLSPRFGSEPRQVTVLRFQQMEGFIRNSYLQSKEQMSRIPGGSLTSQAYGNGFGRLSGGFGHGTP